MYKNGKLTMGFFKEDGAENGLRKGFIKDADAVGLGYPEEILNISGKQYRFPSIPMASTYLDRNGGTKVLYQPFRKGERVDTIPYYGVRSPQSSIASMSVQVPQERINRKVPIESENGMIYENPKTGDRELLCNFFVRPVEVMEVLAGEKLVEKTIMFEVRMSGDDDLLRFSLPTDKLDMLPLVIKKENPAAIVYCRIYNGNAKLVEVVRALLLKNVTRRAKQTRAGWSSFNENMIFFHDAHSDLPGAPIIETGKAILADPAVAGGEYLVIQQILEMAPVKVIAPMIATALLAPLHRLFRDANPAFAPQFVLFVNGRSGSFKTAVSKVLYNVYNAKEPTVPASFKDTPTALEKRLAEYACAPVLVDDFYATGLSRERSGMQKSLEMIIRYVGDGIGKNRSNGALQDVKGIRPTGMVIITGEDTAGQLSTLLRCLIINVDRETFRADVLTEFQNSPLLWSSVMNSFIQYLEANYNSIVGFIRSQYLDSRVKVENLFKDRRPADQLVQCTLAFEILRNYLQGISPCTEDVDNLCNRCIAGCQEALVESQIYAEQNSAEEQFCFALAQAILSEKIVLAESKDLYSYDMAAYDGYKDDEYYICRGDSVYAKIRKNFSDQGRNLALDLLNAKRALDKAGLIVTEVERRGTEKEKKYYDIKVSIKDKRVRMLKIIRNTLDTYIEKN